MLFTAIKPSEKTLDTTAECRSFMLNNLMNLKTCAFLFALVVGTITASLAETPPATPPEVPPDAPAANPAKKRSKKPATPPAAFPGHSPLFEWLMTGYDSNKDLMLNPTERAAVTAAFEKQDFMAAKLDVNSSKKIDADEIDRIVNEPVAEPPGKKPKKAPAPKKKAAADAKKKEE
jgi:hypothetical protein